MNFEIKEIKATGNVSLCERKIITETSRNIFPILKLFRPYRERKSPSQWEWIPIDPDAPIWKKDNDNQTVHIHPAAFIIDKNKPVRLKVTVYIPDAEPGDKYTLTARYVRPAHDVKFYSTSVTNQGNDYVFEVKAQDDPPDFFGICGDFQWVLAPSSTNEPENSSKTKLELYWLYGKDELFNQRGIPVEILRHAAYYYRITGEIESSRTPIPREKGRALVIQSLVYACFYTNPPRYQINSPQDHYINWHYFNELTFYFKRYWADLDDPEAVCCCYDMAAVLQVFLKAVGIAEPKYCVMQPFGFLRFANLKGWGFSNNPLGKYEKKLIIPETSEERLPFGSHAFCCLLEVKNKGKKDNDEFPDQSIPFDPDWPILDAAAGPQIGNMNAVNYVSLAVDSVYPQGGGTPPGTVNDICCFEGVIKIDFDETLKCEPGLLLTPAFKEIVHFSKPLKEEENKYMVVCSWPDPRKSCALRFKGWENFYENIIPGTGETVKIRTLKKKTGRIEIRIYVCSEDNEYALNRFLAIGSLTSLPGNLFRKEFKRGPSDLGQFSAVCESENRSRYLWVYYNVVFDVTFTDVTFKKEKLLKWLQRKARTHKKIKEKVAEYLPAKKDIALDSHLFHPPDVTAPFEPGDMAVHVTIPVGERFTVIYKNRKPKNILLDFTYEKGDSLQLIHETGKSLEFRAVKESKEHEKDKLSVVAVDKDTLLCSTREFFIKVSPGG